MERKQNFLLIGGAGFIGSNIAKQLIKEGYSVSIFELIGTNISRLESIQSEINIYYGTLDQIDLMRSITEENAITTVLHLASSLIPSSNHEMYLKDLEKVVLPSIRLFHFFSEWNIKLIYFSSGGAIYGEKEIGLFTEKDELHPISYYGQSKLILEKSIEFESSKSGLNYIILRPSNPYGIGQNLYGKQGLISTCIHNILTDQKIQIWGDGSVIRDYIYIDDFVDIVVKVINNGMNNQIYNVGSGIGHSVNDIIGLLRNFTNKELDVEYLSSRNVDVPALVLDVTKLQHLINFNYTSIDKGVHTFYQHESKD